MKKIILIIQLFFLSTFYFPQSNESENMAKKYKDFVPQWAKGIVWYQIFPDRFFNGDPSNDPKVENIKGAWPHDSTSPWQIHPWTSDWYQLQSYEKENGKDIWFNIQRRRYGGDLQGIIDKINYLVELGVGAVYLNPVFEAPSLHKYDGATYHHIDPNFGPDPDGDRKLILSEIPDDPSTWVWTSADKLFLKLVDELHQKNIKIIIDGVFNHMGINSWAFRDVVKNQQNSKYKDWFTVKSWDNPATGKKFDYEGWFGVKELPELREDENGIVEGPKKYIFDITKRWMDPDNDGNPSDGIDGWRLDVAYCVKHQFWKDWRKHVRSINPEGYLTAEIVDAIEVNEPYLRGDEFDAVMNYNFAFASAEYFISEKTRIKTSEFDKLLKDLREGFPEEVTFVQQNLFGSHDANRIGSHIVNRDLASYRDWPRYFDLSKGSNPSYDTRKPNKKELKIQKLFAIFQMTYSGAPMIYYGDEAGMWGANDPDCRKPMVWDNLNYDDEVYLPDQTKKLPDKVLFDKDLFNHYKELIKIHNDFPALKLGDIKTIVTDDENEIYAFERSYNNETILVVINNKWEDQEININSQDILRDVQNEEVFKQEKNIITFKVKGKSGRIFLKEKI